MNRRFIAYQPDTWPYRFGLLKRVPEATIVPTGYRLFMRELSHFSYVAAPIGLHLFFGLGRYLWEQSHRVMFPQRWSEEIEMAYMRGEGAGYVHGFRDGKDAGIKQVRDANRADVEYMLGRLRGDGK